MHYRTGFDDGMAIEVGEAVPRYVVSIPAVLVETHANLEQSPPARWRRPRR